MICKRGARTIFEVKTFTVALRGAYAPAAYPGETACSASTDIIFTR